MSGYVGLTRFSPRPGDVVRWSEENQVADIGSWAEKHGERIVAWRHSRFVSGDSSDRFDLPEVLETLKRHGAKGIVCADPLPVVQAGHPELLLRAASVDRRRFRSPLGGGGLG